MIDTACISYMTLWFISILVISILLICLVILRRLVKEKNQLLQERDAVYNFIHDVSDAFVKSDEPNIDFLLKQVLFYALQTTKAGAGAVYFMEPNGNTLRARSISGLFPPIVDGIDEKFASAESKSHHVEKLIKEQNVRLGKGLVGEVAERGLPIIIEDAERDSRIPMFTTDFLHIQSILLAPMRFQNTVMGVLVVINRIDDTPFLQTDLNLLQALADQASVTIYFAKFSEELGKKRMLDYDLQIARKIQNSLLPTEIPEVKGMELAAFSLPAREVGGDYYDFVNIDDDHLGITIADVSGKGVAGAIFMSICRSVFHSNAQGCLSPAHVLKAVNSVISSDIHEDMFISMLYIVLNIKTFEMKIARAGHLKPIIVSSNGHQSFPVESKGIAIGMADTDTFNSHLEEITLTLKPGNIFVAYTDGMFEALNSQHQEWGISNLVNTILSNATASAQMIVNHVQQELLAFIGDMTQYDDMTLVVMSRRKGDNSIHEKDK